MTAAPHIAIGVMSQNKEDVGFSVFQLVNNPNQTQITCGNIFLGLQGSVGVIAPLDTAPSLALARGGKILTDLLSCAVTFTADANWAAGGQILCNVMVDDGPRNGQIDSRLAWKPFNGFLSPSGWRNDAFGPFDQILEDTGGAPFLDSGPGTGSWNMSVIAGLREEMATKFIVPAGPNWSVARAQLELSRSGNPTGSMEVAIQGTMLDGEDHEFPDGVDLGVSAPVLNSTLVAAPASAQATFAFAPDIVLAPGSYWTVIRPNVAYVPDFANWVNWRNKRQFIGLAAAHRHTVPFFRFDQGNYPGHRDIDIDLGPNKQVGTDIVWNIPARTAGQSVQSPDLSPLVQEVILREGHETANALCFTFRTVGQTLSFRFASFAHPTRAAPGFSCQYSRRQVQIGGAL